MLSLSLALSTPERRVDVPLGGIGLPEAGMIAMGMTDWRADAWVALGVMIAMGKAGMATPAVMDILGREPLNIDQFAADYAQAFRGA